jgi:cytochrome c-type biogenesis protein CcmH
LLAVAKPRAEAPRLAPAWIAPALCIVAPLLAAGAYLGLGAPGAPDLPYASRIEEWRRAPETLGPSEAAAVIEQVVRERPADAEARLQLGRARLAAGDAFGAVRALESAARLRPGDKEIWTSAAQAFLSLDPPAVSEARQALVRAQAIDPADPNARYWLGRAAVAEGDVAAGVAAWSALARDLPRGDIRREALLSEIRVAQGGGGAQVDAAIEGMVEGLANRLMRTPNDPEGWARLARAYGVLGRETELEAAMATVRRTFSGRPEVIASVEAAAAAGRERKTLRSGG